VDHTFLSFNIQQGFREMENPITGRSLNATIILLLLCKGVVHVKPFQPSPVTQEYFHSRCIRASCRLKRIHVLTSPESETKTDVPEGRENTLLDFMSTLEEKIGKVGDDRIIFPELESGEVPRLYSSLRYTTSEDGDMRASHKAGSVFGATLLLAASVMGGGILVLPTAALGAGFLASTGAFVVGWFYMTMSGLIVSELCLNHLARSGRPGQQILVVFEEALGDKWKWVASASFFFLYYTMMVAFLAQGGINLESFLSSRGLAGFAAVPGSGQTLLAGFLGLVLYASSSAMIERARIALLVGVTACLAGVVFLASGSMDFAAMIDFSNQHPEAVPSAFPIIFASLVYQQQVPTIVERLEGDRTKITQAIIAGTTLPALLLLAFNAVVLGNVQGLEVQNIDPIAAFQNAEPRITPLIDCLLPLALSTSLFGVTVAVKDGLESVLRLPRDDFKAPLLGLALLPALALSILLATPEALYNTLDISGTFGVSILFLVLPAILVWGQRYGDEQIPLGTKPLGRCLFEIVGSRI
jgi:tyrosine-specific transport protein